MALRCLASIALLLACSAGAQAEAPALVSYRGALVRDDGRAFPDGTYAIAFSVHDAAVAGNTLLRQVRTVHVRRGLYEVQLSEEPGAPLVDAFAGEPRYLEVTVVSGAGLSDVVLTPRQRIASVPYALVAGSTGSFDGEPAPLPVGAIVLWDQPTGCAGEPAACPCGFSPVDDFGGRTMRGAAPAETPGLTQGTPGSPGPHGDILTGDELPAHSHELATAGTHRHRLSGSHQVLDLIYPDLFGLGDNHAVRPLDEIDTDTGGNHTHAIGPAGRDEPHYHPLRTVLFCRKDS